MIQLFNPFVPNASFLYPLKTEENLTVFWCFQGVEKGCIGNEWVNLVPLFSLLMTQIKLLFVSIYKLVQYYQYLDNHRRCFVGKGILKKFTIFTGKHVLESLFNKVASLEACNFIKKRLHFEYYCQYCEIFKITNFDEHLRATASVSRVKNLI